MTLTEFIQLYDKPGSIVLLEGKRNVLKADEDKLFAIGKLLCSLTKHIIFRSGNAPGADELFSEGVVSINQARMQVITPYSGHRKQNSYDIDTYSLDDMNMAAEPEIVYQSKANKKMEKLIDQYVAGSRDRNSIKAAYIIRDTVKVIGSESLAPASFGIFYDDLQKPRSGGTGHTMHVCELNNVPQITQQTWFGWFV